MPGLPRGGAGGGLGPPLLGGSLQIAALGSAQRSAPALCTMGGKKVCIVGSGNW